MRCKHLFVFVILVFSLISCGGSTSNKKEVSLQSDSPINLRIGWQIPWATQGQLTQILKNTELLKAHGLSGEFKGFSYGGPLNEGALAGEVDVVFTADQPAAALLSKDSDWVIIGRLMYNRVSLYVPPESPISTISELKGKTVGMPFGAAAQRMALKVQIEAGLDPKKDVNNVNLGIYEQSDLVRSKTAKTWGQMDALAGFDPTPAILEGKGLVRNLHVGKIVSVILMSKDLIAKYPTAPKKFMQSFYQAYEFYRANTGQANTWFKQEAKLAVTDKALEIAASIEPNLIEQNEIRLGFTDSDYAILQEAADFLTDQGMIRKKVNMKDHINLSYLE